MTKPILFCLLAFALAACGAPANGWMDMTLVDSTCAELLCGWDVAQGGLQPAASWHEHQRAVALAGTPARVTRKIAGTPNIDCFAFSFLSSVDGDADLELQLDFNDDGSIDARAAVPAVAWRNTVLGLRTPSEYRSVRISLEKRGPGEVRISTLVLGSELSACADAPPTTLSDGASCSADSTCTSNRCALGKCEACAAGGCAEGAACRTSDECRDGACAAGRCRACAKAGSCVKGEGCSVSGQCASGSCPLGSQPGLSSYPGVEGVCGECARDADCGDEFCVLGSCSACRGDADCAEGTVCRYADAFEVSTRACLPRITSVVPRGGLCEQSQDCVPGLTCDAAVGRAKRCGIACVSNAECGSGGVCAAPGVSRAVDPPAQLALLPGWSMLTSRIATCYRAATVLNNSCEVQEQCGALGGLACCSGKCQSATLDPDSNRCVGPLILD